MPFLPTNGVDILYLADQAIVSPIADKARTLRVRVILGYQAQ